MKVFKPGVLIFILYLAACKPIGNTVSAVIVNMLAPSLNQDLLQLQYGLYQYKLGNTLWPYDSIELNQYLQDIGLVSINIINYEQFEWSTKGDTIEVIYLLRYNESDSIDLKSLKGEFNLYLDRDSVLHSTHSTKVERKDDKIIKMNGDYKMQFNKPIK